MFWIGGGGGGVVVVVVSVPMVVDRAKVSSPVFISLIYPAIEIYTSWREEKVGKKREGERGSSFPYHWSTNCEGEEVCEPSQSGYLHPSLSFSLIIEESHRTQVEYFMYREREREREVYSIH